MKQINWDNVEEVKEFEKVTAGGYICGITAVNDEPDKEYLKVEYDIADGKFKGYYKALYEAKGFWGGSFIRSYKEKALPFFKGFITAVENSNKGFKFDNDETKLKGKYIGLVLGEEEYIGNSNEVKTRLYVANIHSIDKIRKNEYSVPTLKKIVVPEEAMFNADSYAANSDSLPWEE